MEWNLKSPLQWDWDNLVMFNAKAAGNDGNEVRSLYSFEGGFASASGSAGSGSDLKNATSSKSSKSTSVDSSSIGKTSNLTFEAFEGSPGDFSKKKEISKANMVNASSLLLEASVGSGEPVIGLKLGKRTYFEDFCDGSNTKASPFSVIPTSSAPTTKRSRSSYQSMKDPHCQVEGCNLDLSSAKEYHRKHRICESHAKCPRVIVGGLERRFCQQCSRFHGLAEFDQKKRSCRKRLSDHNARRRKPRQETSQFTAARLPSSLYDGGQQMGLIFNKFPFHHTRPTLNPTSESTFGSKFALTRDYAFMPAETGGADEQLYLSSNVPPSAFAMLSNNSNRCFPPKGATTKVLNEGLEESNNMVAAQDLHRALSLLSTNSWGSCEPEPIPMDHTVHINTRMPHTLPHGESEALPLASPEFWQTDQHSPDSQSHMFTSQSNGSSHFQEFQLFKVPYESGYDNEQLS